MGVLSPVTGGFFFDEVLAGVVREVSAAGGRVTLIQTLDAGRTAETSTTTPEATISAGWRALDGIIVIAWAATREHLHDLQATGKPLVLVSSDDDLDVASVVVDNQTGVRAAVDHLADHGHTRIAFLGNCSQTDIGERRDAFIAQAGARGMQAISIPSDDPYETGGAGAASAIHEAWMSGFTAVMTGTDRIALGLIPALADRGLRVPEDVALVGFDDIESGWVNEPPLTTIGQQFDALGAVAAQLLLKELRGEPTEHRRHDVPGPFIRRRSCGCTQGTSECSPESEGIGEAVAAAVLSCVGLDAPAAALPSRITPEDVNCNGLEVVVTDALAPLFAGRLSPERRRCFTKACMGGLERRSAQLTAEGVDAADAIHDCTLRVLDIFGQRQAAEGFHRFTRLAASHSQQIDVTMDLLEDTAQDPGSLAWLSRIPVRAGLLGLWEGPPESRMLRVRSVYDPGGTLNHLTDRICPLDEFPPAEFTELPEAENDEATYVIPVRGPTGDHGFLCLNGKAYTDLAASTAPYNRWAAQLGAALRSKNMHDTIRVSAEMYTDLAEVADGGL